MCVSGPGAGAGAGPGPSYRDSPTVSTFISVTTLSVCPVCVCVFV